MPGFKFAIDRGGTFTDVFARCPDGEVIVTKLLSEDPQNYSDAPREGIRRIIQQKTGKEIPADAPLGTDDLEWIRMGTTVATNALLERKGERIALLVTSGFRDLLFIGNQTRPKIFDLRIICPDVLYENVTEVDERVILIQDQCKLNENYTVDIGKTGDSVKICKPLDEQKLRRDLQTVLDQGIKSLAVVLMHSYIYSKHEERVGEIALEMGFHHISLSSKVMPMVKIVPRGFTACADAYLTPHVRKYVKSFASGFEKHLQGVSVQFMQSDGGVTPMEKFIGCRAILSGPAGGVVGYAMTTYSKETEMPVIGFDMGGTSTDVSRYAGQYEHVFESITAGITIQAPQLDINTVAAGGGSMLFFRSGRFVVGPESAGAHPGPICYRKGGPLTVTDANLCLGRILVDFFPKIFGPKEDQPLDLEATKRQFEKITKEINSYIEQRDGKDAKLLSVEEVAIGFIKVANEAMCQPIRTLTQGRGFDTSKHVLACFGGAGGQHACSIARSLGMSTVFIHRYAGILSAYGMALADVVHEAQVPSTSSYSSENFGYIDAKIDELMIECKAALQQQGFHDDNIILEPFLHLRYDKTDCAVMCSGFLCPSVHGKTSKHGDFLRAFIERYSKEFGFLLQERMIMVDDIRVRGVGKSNVEVQDEIPNADSTLPTVEMVKKCYFENGYHKTNVYILEKLLAGHVIEGPAIIIDKTSTILVEPFCKASITKKGDVKIEVNSVQSQQVGTSLDTIQLSIFSHRFMSIAEQMGRILQRTSISTNIKERLDFSCALFGPDGGLVSNAPHIPIHLGAMQDAVQYQMREVGDSLTKGDVLLSNHPYAGGSHLPDLTVITPVFYQGIGKPVFYVASRGHHSDIGGITPGSMPPHSTSIHQEGATFKSFKLVKEGIFQEKDLIEALMAPGKHPGSSGTRNLKDNISDLQAQIAANQRGIKLVSELIDEYGLQVVQAYMMHIQNNAEVSVRDMLKTIADSMENNQNGLTRLHASDYLDNGSVINLNILIDRDSGSAIFDFEGTGYEMHGNLNTPRAVTMSAIIYCLRCMVKHDVPLNQGCLNPVTVKLPKQSLLLPSENAAVVGGNVLTSQRLVDVILKAFSVCAASQGCTNNITFGDENSGYYETVCGGAGAGPNWHGRSGVHTHITNTRMTDPEILEKRYPVILKNFHLNAGTGGRGQFKGGDGIIRELLFRKKLSLSVLTERRVFSPYGLAGGEDGKKGKNYMYYADGRIVNLGSKNFVDVNAGDIFHLETPGGGGYGPIDKASPEEIKVDDGIKTFIQRGSVFNYSIAQESA